MAMAAPAGAREETVRIPVAGQDVVGTLVLPDAAPAPAVLMLHGFTGTRDEVPVAGTGEGLFERTARLLAEAGVASLRIDFRGSGESGMGWAETTIPTQIADAVAALDWLAADPRIEGVTLLGYSLGGLVAAHAAAERPGIRSLILWAPVTHPLETFRAILGPQALAAAARRPADAAVPEAAPLAPGVLNAGFYHALADHPTPAALARYPGPMLLVLGERDSVVSPWAETVSGLLGAHEGPQGMDLLDADHGWNVSAGPGTLDGPLLGATLDFLGRH